MIEGLLSFAILLQSGLITLNDYNMYLNEIFLQNPDNNLLLELEWCSTNSQNTIACITEYSRKAKIDYAIFGKCLLSELKTVYKGMDINNFAAKAYSIWELLPISINQTEPFWTLSYADEPLSWGDEKQTRKLYEKMFEYYQRNDSL